MQSNGDSGLKGLESDHKIWGESKAVKYVISARTEKGPEPLLSFICMLFVVGVKC